VSDRPLHGEIKLPGMGDTFYEERVGQHLQIGISRAGAAAQGGPRRHAAFAQAGAALPNRRLDRIASRLWGVSATVTSAEACANSAV